MLPNQLTVCRVWERQRKHRKRYGTDAPSLGHHAEHTNMATDEYLFKAAGLQTYRSRASCYALRCGLLLTLRAGHMATAGRSARDRLSNSFTTWAIWLRNNFVWCDTGSLRL